MKEKLQSFFGGVMTGIKPDMLPPFASPFGANAIIERIAGEQGRVRRRKGALTMSYQPLSGEPEVLGIFHYPATGGDKIVVIGADGTVQVENPVNLIPIMPDFYPVIASFTVSGTQAVGQTLTFTVGASDPNPNDSIAQYRWDFGDGSGISITLTGSNTKVYGAAGTYTVTVLVDDNDGNTTSATLEIEVV